MRKKQQCKENTAFICRCLRRVHEHQIHNQLIKICFVGKYGSIEPIYFTSRSRIYEQTGLVPQASKHISHVNVYGRYEVTILVACSKRSDSGERCEVKIAIKSRGGLGRVMAPNLSIVTVTGKPGLFSFNLLHSGESETSLLVIKTMSFPFILFTAAPNAGNIDCELLSSLLFGK